MALTPVATAALIGAGASALTSLPTLIPNKTDRENKRRLKELERKAAMGALGLSADEEAVLTNRLSARSAQAQAAADAERNALLAGGGVTGGAALQAAVASDAERARSESENAARVAEADLAQKQAQREEIAALQAAVSERTGQKVAAATGIATGALEAGITTSAQQQYMQGKLKADETAVKGLAAAYGISEDEARGLYEAVNRNPQLGTLFDAMRGSQTRQR